jgi:hypothetical protein
LSALLFLFVTLALSAIILMVLRSLARSGVLGVREWTGANVLAIVALLLFAARGRIPDILSIHVANLLFLGAPALMLAGFERHLGRRAPYRALAVLMSASTLALAIFHYWADAMAGASRYPPFSTASCAWPWPGVCGPGRMPTGPVIRSGSRSAPR